IRAASEFSTPTPRPARGRFTTVCGCSVCQATGVSRPQARGALPVSGATPAPGRAPASSGGGAPAAGPGAPPAGATGRVGATPEGAGSVGSVGSEAAPGPG